MAKRKKANAGRSPIILKLRRSQLDNNKGSGGLEIGVFGHKGDPCDANPAPCQIFLEWYEGKLQLHVWDGSAADPKTIIIPEA